jgi:hypothetical protein
MKIFNKNIFILLGLAFLIQACEFFKLEEVVDPNNPSLASILNQPSQKQINELAVGIQAVMRNGLLDFYRITGSVGREVVYSASTDNRYFNELLGTESANFGGANDPNGIFNTYYFAYSQTRRRAEIFIRSAETATEQVLTTQQKSGVKGFAKTIQAYVMLNLLNMQLNNGIRSGFTDLAAPGDLLKPLPFTDYNGGLALIKQLLDAAATDLDQAGTAFDFPIVSGFSAFNTPANFKKFNRAIAARVAMYQKNWTEMQTALSASFLDIDGSMTTGCVFTFSTTPNDQVNPLFQNKNTDGAPFVVFNEHILSAEAGDTRVFGSTAKVNQRNTPRQSGSSITSTHEVFMYASNVSSVSVIRNEELILMWAEAKIQQDQFADAVIALDKIRTAFGLQNLATAKPTILNDKAALIDELLNQRRYSLFFEGHRWFDARRYDKVSTLPLQTGSFKVFTNLNRPDAETQWEIRNP